MRVELHPEARAELRSAALWYDERRPGLGDEFIAEMSTALEDLIIPAGNRLERLRGDQAGRHSIRINDQYRVTFRWKQGHAYEVRVEDDH